MCYKSVTLDKSFSFLEWQEKYLNQIKYAWYAVGDLGQPEKQILVRGLAE